MVTNKRSYVFMGISLSTALQSSSLLEGLDERGLLSTVTFPAQCMTLKCLRAREVERWPWVCFFPLCSTQAAAVISLK